MTNLNNLASTQTGRNQSPRNEQITPFGLRVAAS
jgi:hypothetical protein